MEIADEDGHSANPGRPLVNTSFDTVVISGAEQTIQVPVNLRQFI
jgi:hypothetical protein